MRMEVRLQNRLEQRMKLAPQIIQSIEILQLPMLDLQEVIKAELEENPTLEMEREVQEETPAEKEERVELGPERETASDEDAANKDLERTLQVLERQEQDEYGDFSSQQWLQRDDGGRDKKLEALQNTPSRSGSLQDHLYSQFTLLEMSERMRRIGKHIIYNIDSNGYLKHPLPEISESVNQYLREKIEDLLQRSIRFARDAEGPETPKERTFNSLDPEGDDLELQKWIVMALNDDGSCPRATAELFEAHRVTEQDVDSALKLIQGLDPAGIGARSTRECLLLQLADDDADVEFKRVLIADFLEDIGANKLPRIAKETGRSIDEVKRVVAAIQHMNPKPGATFAGESVPYITPDVVIEYVENRYEVRLEDAYIPRLMISPYCRRILGDRGATEKVRDFIRKKIESAKRLIGAIQQRQHTLYRIASEIVRIQQEFFAHGVSHLKPLRMQEVADNLGIHVSTVSRAIAEKYMQTPRGIFPLKFFFSGATECSEGEAHSRVSVITQIKELIGREDKQDPLGDNRIVEILRKEGLDIARRTVTKYRKALGILSSRQRKEY